MQDRVLESLRRRVEQLSRGRGVRFPSALRAEWMVWTAARLAEGSTWDEVASETAVRAPTLKRWFTPRERVDCAVALRPVEIVDAPLAETITVITPRGLRLEGVSIESAIALLRGLT